MARNGNRGLLSAFGLLIGLGLGCSPPARDTILRFTGQPSFGAMFADTRSIQESCPACEQPVTRGDARCLRESCRAELIHPSEGPCGFCRESGACVPCAVFESGGRCRHCRGAGRLPGDAPCLNCQASGKCAACAGSRACDACGGRKRISFPWARVIPQAAKTAALPGPVVRQDRQVFWLGESVSWASERPASPAVWTIWREEEGKLREVERIAGDPARYTPRQPGFHRASSNAGSVCFDTVEVTLSEAPGKPGAECVPALREMSVIRVDSPEGSGRQETRVRVETAGLPPREVTKLIGFQVSGLRVATAARGPVRSDAPISFRAESTPPIPEGAACEWTIAADGKSVSRVTRGPILEHAFPAAGRYRVRARAGAAESAPHEVLVYRVSVVDGMGRAMTECRLETLEDRAFDTQGRLREEAILASPERLRVMVEDPAADGPGTVTVATRSSDHGPVNLPLTFSLSGPPERRVSRLFLLLGDRFDDLAACGGKADDAPEDPTLHAVPRGRLELFYRGSSAATLAIGPMIVHEIPVRFTAVGPGLPPQAELERAIDLRLAQANAVWEPFGRRFTRAPVSRMEVPRDLLLIRGRAAGLDARGRPSRAGALIDGREISIPTVWRDDGGPVLPLAASHSLTAKAGASWRIDAYENFLAGDREAVVLRFRRADGAPAVLGPLEAGHDVGQSVGPLSVDFSDGCEVTLRARSLSLEEMALLAAGKSAGAEGIDAFIVSEIRSLDARRSFKVYPEGIYPPRLGNSALLSWSILEGSGRYPYALARAFGELILPPSTPIQEGDTLFADPMTEAPGTNANKRITAATAVRISERGRALPDPK